MKVNFNVIEDVQNFVPLPDGQYLCRLSQVEESSTQNGDDMWKLRFEVVNGQHEGRFIFDNMVFSEAAIKRVKLICACLGIDINGEVDLTPELLKDRHCLVTVVTEEFVDSEGTSKTRNSVPFAGYKLADEAAVSMASKGEGENVPF
jgi:hypothetical protein